MSWVVIYVVLNAGNVATSSFPVQGEQACRAAVAELAKNTVNATCVKAY